jgi:hypothetical protein
MLLLKRYNKYIIWTGQFQEIFGDCVKFVHTAFFIYAVLFKSDKQKCMILQGFCDSMNQV